MKITDFANKVAAKEGGKNQISIAQISEVLKIVDDFFGGLFYAMIKWMK